MIIKAELIDIIYTNEVNINELEYDLLFKDIQSILDLYISKKVYIQKDDLILSNVNYMVKIVSVCYCDNCIMYECSICS